MSKKCDFFVNKQNTPHLQLYTKLIGWFCGFTGLNFLLIFLYAKFQINNEYNILFLFLSILMFSSISDHINDPRKGNRDLKAVIAGGIVHCVCTIACSMYVKIWWLLIIYGVELLVVMLVAIQYFRQHKRK